MATTLPPAASSRSDANVLHPEGGVHDRLPILGIKSRNGLLQHHGTVLRSHHAPRSLPANSSTISAKDSSASVT